MFFYASKPVKEIAVEETWSPEIIDLIKKYNDTFVETGRSALINSLIVQVFHYFAKNSIDCIETGILGVKSSFICSENFSAPVYTIEKFQIVRNFVLLALIEDWHHKIVSYMKEYSPEAKITNGKIKSTDKSETNIIAFQEICLQLLQETLKNCSNCLKLSLASKEKHQLQSFSITPLRDLFSTLPEFSGLELKNGKIHVNILVHKAPENLEFNDLKEKFSYLLKNNMHIILNEIYKNSSNSKIISLALWINYCLKQKDFTDSICTTDLINSLILESARAEKDEKQINKNRKTIENLQKHSQQLKQISNNFSAEINNSLNSLWNIHFIPHIEKDINTYHQKREENIKNLEKWRKKEKDKEFIHEIEMREGKDAKQALEKQLGLTSKLGNTSLLLAGAGLPIAMYMGSNRVPQESSPQKINVSSSDSNLELRTWD